MAGEPHELFRQWLTDHKGLLFKVVRAYADAPEDQEDLFQVKKQLAELLKGPNYEL